MKRARYEFVLIKSDGGRKRVTYTVDRLDKLFRHVWYLAYTQIQRRMLRHELVKSFAYRTMLRKIQLKAGVLGNPTPATERKLKELAGQIEMALASGEVPNEPER